MVTLTKEYGEEMMTLLKDELMEATGLSEDALKKKLLDKAPKSIQAEGLIKTNAVTKDSWAYLTACYGFNAKDRMLAAIC